MKITWTKLSTSNGFLLTDQHLKHLVCQEFAAICEKLELLHLHSFIAREQAAFYTNSKTSGVGNLKLTHSSGGIALQNQHSRQ